MLWKSGLRHSKAALIGWSHEMTGIWFIGAYGVLLLGQCLFFLATGALAALVVFVMFALIERPGNEKERIRFGSAGEKSYAERAAERELDRAITKSYWEDVAAARKRG